MTISWPDLQLPPINLWNYPDPMRNNIMSEDYSVTTKTGDSGATDGPGGLRVPKNDPFIALVGALDEVNAQIGVCDGLVEREIDIIESEIQKIERMRFGNDIVEDIKEIDIQIERRTNRLNDILHSTSCLKQIQHKLLDMGAELYTGEIYVTQWDVEFLEKIIKENEVNPGGFIVPNELLSSSLHLAKAMVRRAEREAIACKNPTTFVTDEIIRYLNRLSDALYVLSLTVAKRPHIMWIRSREM